MNHASCDITQQESCNKREVDQHRDWSQPKKEKVNEKMKGVKEVWEVNLILQQREYILNKNVGKVVR